MWGLGYLEHGTTVHSLGGPSASHGLKVIPATVAQRLKCKGSGALIAVVLLVIHGVGTAHDQTPKPTRAAATHRFTLSAASTRRAFSTSTGSSLALATQRNT